MNDSPDTFTVSFGNGGRQLDLDEVRARRRPVMPDGEHAWVIHAIYSVEDPDQAMDDMELGEKQFVGVTDIHCLLCHEHYKPGIRHHKCPQKLS